MGLFGNLFSENQRHNESKLKKIIDEDGLLATINMLTDLTNQKINSKAIALQFILEELEAASQGNNDSIEFVKNSGFSKDEYENSMMNSMEEVDGPNGPQEFLTILLELNDRTLMAKIRIAIVDNIMKKWGLGKYMQQTIQINNKNIINAAISIANDCIKEGPTNPMYQKIYNGALDNMYSNALYLGYGASDGVIIDLNDPMESGVKKLLNFLISIKAPKENIHKALIRLLTDKKLNDFEKQTLMGNLSK